jgi:hypothetical protein
MYQLNKQNQHGLKRSSTTFPSEQLIKILGTPGAYVIGHFECPAPQNGRHGNHFDAVYIPEPISGNPEFVQWIVDDIVLWSKKENLEFEVILAPAQDAVKAFVSPLAERLGKRVAYLDYFPSGWLGGKLVEGEIKQGDRVLVFNAISQTGRDLGETLPKLVEQLGGTTIGAASFCKGTTGGVIQAEHKYGSKFYATIQAHIGIKSPTDCLQCKDESKKELKPWTDVLDAAKAASA